MNVEKLYSVLLMIKEDFDNQKIISKFSEFTWKMQQYIDDSTNENSATFKAALDEFNQSLEIFQSNKLVPSKYHILTELKAHNLVGLGLRRCVENILGENNSTQTDILQNLTELLSDVNGFYERMADIVRGFSHFSFEQDVLESTEFELGVIYPMDRYDLSLVTLKSELSFINKLLSDICEVQGENAVQTKIRSLSSGSIELHLKTTVRVADTVMNLVSGVVDVYSTISDIQQKSKELEKLGVSSEIINLLKEEEKSKIDKGLEALKTNLFVDTKVKKGDKGRLNELENSISIDLKQLAQKIESGLKIEVSVPMLSNNSSIEIEGVNIASLAERGRLMTTSSMVHEPVLLLPSEALDKDKEESSKKEVMEKMPVKEVKGLKEKKEAKNSKIDTNIDTGIDEDIPINTNIDTDSDAEFDWEVVDD